MINSDLLYGDVFEFLVKESRNNKEIWNYNGGMIDGRSDSNLNDSKIGVNFMSSLLQTIQPKRIIETGTNYGSFGYICYKNLSDFRLDTCDIVKDSGRCVDYINNSFDKENIIFHNEDSISFLKGMLENNVKVDMAWLDSLHTFDHLKEELHVTSKMKVPYIIVDDFWWKRDIQLAVYDFLIKNEEYRFHSYSNNNSRIGSIISLKLV